MKVISISGTQGAGKTTMLAELKKRGWQVDVEKKTGICRSFLLTNISLGTHRAIS